MHLNQSRAIAPQQGCLRFELDRALVQTPVFGYFFNCNADKLKYTKLGIGTIKRADTQACENVVNTMRYLAKEEQHLRIKPIRARTFGMGHLPR